MKAHLVVGLLGWALASGAAQQTNSQPSIPINELPKFTSIAKRGDKTLGTIGILSLGILSKAAVQSNSNNVISDSRDLKASSESAGTVAISRKKPAVGYDHLFAEVYRSKRIGGILDLRKPVDPVSFKQRVTIPARTDQIGRSAAGIKLFSIRF